MEKKLLDMCLLMRIQKETAGFLPDWAYGFIAGRSCRDALLTAAMTNRRVAALAGAMEIALIDVKSAFTAVSHKGTDQAMAAAGCSAKTRRMFRAIYDAAQCEIRVTDPHTREEVHSNPYDWNRGTWQGAASSPIRICTRI